jgi:putrescine transport system substrate-binding protein
MRESQRICLAASLLAVLLAPGARADEPRVLNVYNWADYIGPTTIADFEAETGIRINYDTYTSSEMVEAKLLAGSTGYDVIFHAGDYAARLIPLGTFLPLDHAKISSWKYLDPDLLRTMAGYDEGNRYSAPYMWGSTGFAYDVEKIRERMPDAPVDSAAMTCSAWRSSTWARTRTAPIPSRSHAPKRPCAASTATSATTTPRAC